jgi:L-ascorbate metabolism protein UlaG (beta-lactamase superfamily)
MIAIAAAVLALAAPASPAPVRVTYLANEGVLIDGPCAVLVDALFRDSLGDYQRHAPAVREALETARPPFDAVGLALATHYHLDHWDAGAIARFLGSSPGALYASPPEAGAMLPYGLRDRVKALSGGARRVEGGGARVEAIPLEHRAWPHLGYRIDCGGRVLTHLGDASATEANYAQVLAAGPADVALVPYWWLLDDGGRAFLLERWKPQRVIAFHVAVGDRDAEAKARAAAPGAWICTRPGEARTY